MKNLAYRILKTAERWEAIAAEKRGNADAVGRTSPDYFGYMNDAWTLEECARAVRPLATEKGKNE